MSNEKYLSKLIGSHGNVQTQNKGKNWVLLITYVK